MSTLPGQRLVAQSTAAPERPTPPNVVLVLLDDAHFDDMGVYGGQRAKTPHFDDLAARGMRFEQYYANGLSCSPTRAALMTGLYPHRLNIKYVIRYVGYPGPREGALSSPSARGIPARVETLAEVFREAEYATLHLGKWHLGRRHSEYLPVQQGFDHSVVAGAGPESIHRGNNLFLDESWKTWRHADGGVEKGEGYLTDGLADRAIAFIREHRDERFFLNLWFVAPHEPLDPPPRWAERYPEDEPGRYAAMISHLDENVGRIVDVLDELRLREDTLILVTSDNGGERASHPSSRLHGTKGALYEGGIRMPLIASWPGTVPENIVNRDDLVMSMDVLPTMREILGVPPSPLAPPADGRSFAPLLIGAREAGPERIVFWEHGGAQWPRAESDRFAVRQGPWKVLRERGAPRLFDLEADPLEQVDLARKKPEVVERLVEAYRDWREGRRLPWSVRTADGRPLAKDGSGRFSCGGEVGVARFEDDALFDVHDGDFSFSAWVRLGKPSSRRRELAAKAGSWILRVDDQGRPGLEIWGDGEKEPRLLAGPESIVDGAWHHLAFVVRGHRRHEALVSLFLDGEVLDRDASLLAVRPGQDPILLCGKGDELSKAEVTWDDLRLDVMPLSDEEVAERCVRLPKGDPESSLPTEAARSDS